MTETTHSDQSSPRAEVPRVVLAMTRRAMLWNERARDLEIASKRAAIAIAAVARETDVIVCHDLCEQDDSAAQTLQEHLAQMMPGRTIATLLTDMVVDPADPAFARPTRLTGPRYPPAEGLRTAIRNGWTMVGEGTDLRRVIAEPDPIGVLGLGAVETLVARGALVLCSTGSGAPVERRGDGRLRSLEARVDFDRGAALTAELVSADLFVQITDVAAVMHDWGTASPTPILNLTSDEAQTMYLDRHSMAPKVQAARGYVEATGGRAAIGRIDHLPQVICGIAGTQITETADGVPAMWSGASSA